MKHITYCILFLALLTSCSEKEHTSSFQLEMKVDTFLLPKTVVRAIDVDAKGNVYFGGSHGVWGYSTNQGTNIIIDSIRINDSIAPDFRSIYLVDSTTLYLVSVYDPAAIIELNYQTKKWHVIHTDTAKDAFFDMITFNSSGDGFLLGDPSDGCFNLFIKQQDDSTWSKVNCNNIPASKEKEAPFAASNTNVKYIDSTIWFATGGESISRVYKSTNMGSSWETFNTPIIAGRTMTGIYSIDFVNQLTGIIAGGNWDSVPERTANLAVTRDGGETWLLKDHSLPYISCVQFLPNSNGDAALLLSGRGRLGPSTMYYYDIAKDTCYQFPNGNFLSAKFASDSIAWLGGKSKLGKLKVTR